MLKIIRDLDALDFRQLMDIYEETNRLYGARDYGNLSENLQLMYAEQDFYAYLKLFFKDRESLYFIWAPDGEYKAALRLERYEDGLIVTGLETRPADRQKGYSTALMKEMISNLSGVKLYSHIEKSNVPSLRLHQKLGFCIISDTATYIDGTFHKEACTVCLDII